MRKTPLLIAAFVSVGMYACTDDMHEPGNDPAPQEGNSTGGEGNTFDHPDSEVDVWKLLEKLQEQGPPKYTARVHGCPKMKYDTIGRVLASRGVDIGNGTQLSAGQIYQSSDQALGVANYAARQRENLELTTAAAGKLFDIFVQAAPEIIATMPNRTECQIGGVGAQMFNASNQCEADGITCLIGVPATASHIELCNLTVSRASDVETGKKMAVAALLAAAHTCE
ncbi:MAG TPA: hypothetical protein VL463_18285 [Kofleriaceae bacterium]|nr:hypothetical protein [Kofleriaceae bacterium]